MAQPEQPVELDETVLDEGRQRRFAARDRAGLIETLIDPGRCRPAGAGDRQEWPDGALPDFLADRYELVRRLDLPGSQGALYLVRSRTDGTEAVLKRRHTDRPLDSGLVGYLRVPDGHLVRHLEAGAGYEVMDFVPGRTLREQLAASPRGFDFAELHAVVQQLSTGLMELHRAGFVHRDVKPVNVVVRPSGPLHVTLVDFGIAGPLGGTQWPDEPNLAYQPPEWSNRRRVGEQTDWWGLGMTIVELASGEHPFKDLVDDDIADHFGASRAVDVSGVPDDSPAQGTGRLNRLRDLCQGLLVLDPDRRWGADEVGRWLVGEDPELPESIAVRSRPVESAEIAASHPFSFAGRDHFFRRDLATALATDWNYAAQLLFERGGIGELREWLDEFSDLEGAEARGVADAVAADTTQSGNVRLLRIVRALDATRPPVYRNHVISRHHLAVIAHRALDNDTDHVSVLTDLWNYGLLPGFDSAAPDGLEAGGEGLTEVDRDWRRARENWPALIEQVGDAAAQDYLRSAVGERQVLAVCLRDVLAHPAELHDERQHVHQAAAALPVRMPWFDQVVRQPAMLWVAVLLHPHASIRARFEADRIGDEERSQDVLRIEAAFREWSRRQNRPAALGWAVAGTCLLAALWLSLVTAADLAQRAGDGVIEQAWAGAAVCLVVSLIAECLLAAEIGGRFHRRYSIPGAGSLALRPVARWMQRSRWTAASAILSASAGIGWVALHAPLVVGLAATAGHLGWVARRWRAWQAQQVAEDARVAAAELRQPSGPAEAAQGTAAEPSRPSEMDAIPTGTGGGVGA